jgi:hypothetical protein
MPKGGPPGGGAVRGLVRARKVWWLSDSHDRARRWKRAQSETVRLSLRGLAYATGRPKAALFFWMLQQGP